jgi:hypothetical protein
MGKGTAQQVLTQARRRRASEYLRILGLQIGVIERSNLGEHFIKLRSRHTPLTLPGAEKSSAN